MHDCPCCGQAVYSDTQLLCGYCRGGDFTDCFPGAWHCTCGRACDGSACPGPEQPWERNVGPADRGAL